MALNDSIPAYFSHLEGQYSIKRGFFPDAEGGKMQHEGTIFAEKTLSVSAILVYNT